MKVFIYATYSSFDDSIVGLGPIIQHFYAYICVVYTEAMQLPKNNLVTMLASTGMSESLHYVLLAEGTFRLLVSKLSLSPLAINLGVLRFTNLKVEFNFLVECGCVLK